MRRVARAALVVAVAWSCAIAPSSAQQPEKRLDALPRAASSTATITPIYGQLLMFSMPAGFSAADSSDVGGKYVQRSLPAGQRLDRWIEMLVVTGERDAASSGVSPQALAEGTAGTIRRSCPTTFSVASFGAVKVGRFDGFATVIACGTVDPVRPASQTLLLVTIQGARDLYTLQWIERGPPAKGALVIDPARWQDRLARIAPVRLCDVVPGEAPPYASCTNRR